MICSCVSFKDKFSFAELHMTTCNEPEVTTGSIVTQDLDIISFMMEIWRWKDIFCIDQYFFQCIYTCIYITNLHRTGLPTVHKHYASSVKPYKPWCNNILGKIGQLIGTCFSSPISFSFLFFLNLPVVITMFSNMVYAAEISLNDVVKQ